MTRRLALVAAFAVVAAACTSTAATSSTAAPAAGSPPSTTTATTRAPTTTTTTEAPLRTVAIDDDGLPEDLAPVVEAFASWLVDRRNPVPPLAVDLGGLPEVERPARLAATAFASELPEAGRVAVVHLGDDLVLAADDGDGWRIAGVVLPGAVPRLGPEPGFVLVIGSDARPGQDPLRFNADSLHVLTAVPSRGAGTILGVPRDSYLESEFGPLKASAVMTKGGPEAEARHFRAGFGIPVEGYVVTGFLGFERLLGEIVSRLTLVVPRPIPTQPWWPGFREGEQRLTPQRVLEFARTRKGVPGGDLARSYHQGLVMLAVLDVLQERGVDAVPDLLATLLRHTSTDLPPSRLLQLGVAAMRLDPAAVTNVVLPGRLGRAANRASVIFLEDDAWAMVDDLVEDGLLETTP